ncbi:MAG TPA: SPASM domain-containing protein [Bryobacteraceae bacterium]|nr:SPASM domain-containing protein [Bryobacteraceae bacterium]
MQAAKTPRILWVELTSKCPFDCVFCSRKSRRGSGEHMPYPVFESLVRQVSDPRKFLLNYSGESTVYPELIPAIRLARSTGAAVELVSALASASDALLEQLSTSGLTRLTVSIHAADAGGFAEIYRYSCFETLRARLGRLVELCRTVAHPPEIDVAFVAMQRNLSALTGVAEMADGLGLRGLSVFPVIRRDDIPVVFPEELTQAGEHREPFRDGVCRSVEEAKQRFPGIAFTICNPYFTSSGATLGEVPTACPGEMPAGARIHSCEQNPWETAHVLSNGDVVACEVHDKTPLGNLARQSLAEIWHGEAYGRFRSGYHRGESNECRTCPWKTAYVPGRLHSEILGSRGRSAQLWHGWHDPAGEGHVWASQQAVAILEPRAGSGVLHVGGVLPPGPEGQVNELSVVCNEVPLGQVTNESADMLPFGIDFAAPAAAERPWQIEFRTRHIYRARRDQRDLGFALVLLASQPAVDRDLVRRQNRAVAPLMKAIRHIDRLGRMIGCRHTKRRAAESARSFAPGLSVIIPERDNIGEFSACVAALREAARRWTEPLEVLAVVNGCQSSQYGDLRAMHPEIRWQFYPQPLGFGAAIRAGLRDARYDWVYLLNSDVVLDPDALTTAAECRDPLVFSIASQIMLRDPTRFRDETNRTTLFLENGLATTHDLIPESAGTVEHFYAGGGASMFQRRLLGRMIDARAYHPFYWEDVEWGWRARKLGFRSLFCGASVAQHTQGATISRYYCPQEIETIVERNRLLFQLRNFTTVGRLEDVASTIARRERGVADYFLDRRTLLLVARGRLWNHIAPVPDEEVLRSG